MANNWYIVPTFFAQQCCAVCIPLLLLVCSCTQHTSMRPTSVPPPLLLHANFLPILSR